MLLPENTSLPIEIRLAGMLMEVMEVQPLKALSPIDSTPLGRSVSSLEQFRKASLPIVLTPVPKITEVRLEQPLKAESPMLVTLSGMSMEVRLEQ